MCNPAFCPRGRSGPWAMAPKCTTGCTGTSGNIPISAMTPLPIWAPTDGISGSARSISAAVAPIAATVSAAFRAGEWSPRPHPFHGSALLRCVVDNEVRK